MEEGTEEMGLAAMGGGDRAVSVGFFRSLEISGVMGIFFSLLIDHLVSTSIIALYFSLSLFLFLLLITAFLHLQATDRLAPSSTYLPGIDGSKDKAGRNPDPVLSGIFACTAYNSYSRFSSHTLRICT